MTGKQFFLFVGVGAIIMLLVFIGLVLLKDEGRSTVATPEEKKEFTIAAFGDSLTAGYGVDITESYPYVLEQKLKEEGFSVKVINMGVSGETTSGGVERVAFVLEQNPDIVLLGLGANDMLRSLPPSLIKENLNTILQAFAENNKKVVLLGMQSSITNGKTYREEFNKIYEDLAKEYSLPLVPFFLDGVALRPSLNNNDGIHPNKDGYIKIVEDNIMPVLLPYLKKL